jgi:hypothetical protein
MSVKKSSSSNGSCTIDEAQRGLRLRQSLFQKLGVEKDIEYATGVLVLIDVKQLSDSSIFPRKAIHKLLRAHLTRPDRLRES